MGTRREDLEVVVAASTEQLASDLSRAAGMLKAFGQTVSRTKAPDLPMMPSASLATFRAALNLTSRMGSAARSAAGSFASLAKSAASTAAGMAAYSAASAGFNGLMESVRESIKLAADLEQTQLSFEVMLKSAERAQEMVAGLRKFAAETPFNSREVTDAARQLMAYGVSAQQVLPTLRVLGDVTSGLGGKTNLSDMAYLYGTLNSQGRAYTKDIVQFTNRGIQLMPGLAKQFGVSEEKLHAFIEEGRVGIEHVGRALEDLRSRGGAFEDMMARQSQTTAGAWQVATDAFEIAKTQFGQVIIEEAGLKNAARDFEGFSKRIEQAIAAPDSPVRKAVRCLADLSKSGLQVAYDFGRAAYRFAELKLDGLQLPKLDTRQWGATLFEAVGVPLAHAADWAGEFGKEFRENVLKPVGEFIEGLRAIPDMLDDLVTPSKWLKLEVDTTNQEAARDAMRNGGWRSPAMAAKFQTEKPWDRFVLGGMPDPSEWQRLFSPRREGETDVSFAKRFRDLQTLIGSQHFLATHPFDRATEGERKRKFDELDALLQLRLRNFVAPYSTGAPEDFDRLKGFYDLGRVPPMRPGAVLPPMPPAVDNRAGMLNRPLTNVEMVREAVRSLRHDQALEEFRDEMEKIGADVAAFTTASVRRMDTLRATLPLAPYPVGPAAEAAFRDPMELIRAAMRFAPSPVNAGFPMQDNRLLQFKNRPGPNIVELASKVSDELNPAAPLLRQKRDLDTAVDFGLLSREQADIAHGRAVRELAERMGIGGPIQMPGAALVGTSEDAKLINAFRTGQTQETTDSLLRSILEAINRQTGIVSRDADNNARKRATIGDFLPL